MKDNRRYPKVYYPGRDFCTSIEYSGNYILQEMIKPFWKWLLIFLMLWVPILRFLPQGMLLRAAVKRNHISFDNAGGSFGKGFGFWVISLFYLGIAGLLFYLLTIPIEYIFFNIYLEETSVFLLILLLVMIIAVFLIPVFSIFFYIPAVINYARNGFRYAFHFRENLQMIRDAGWGRYIGSFLFIGFIAVCYAVIIWNNLKGTGSYPFGSTMVLIPFIFLLVGSFLYPLIMAFSIRFFCNIFAETSVISDEECLKKIERAVSRTTGLKNALEEHYAFQEYAWIEAFLKKDENVRIIGNILRKDENLILSADDIRYYTRVWFYGKCQ